MNSGGAEQTGMRSHWQLCSGVEDGASLVTGAGKQEFHPPQSAGEGGPTSIQCGRLRPTSSLMPHQPAAHCSRWLFYTLRYEL